jgi:hypothetical protein
LTMPAKHYTSRQIFVYLTGRAAEAEAADLERHLAVCDRCVSRARREYKAATEPAWWTPRAPESAPATVAAPAPEPVRRRLPGFGSILVPALAAAVILTVVFGYVLWNISRRRSPDVPVADPVIASLMDTKGRVILTQSGEIVLPRGSTPPSDLSATVRELLTKTVVRPPDTIQLALAATRTDRLERGPSGEAAEDPLLLFPIATAVRATRPTFSWRPVKSATGYALYVKGRNKKDVWRGPVGEGTSFTLPSTAPELVRGEVYRWQVEATVEDEPRLSRWDSFVVLDEAGLDAVTAGEKLYPDSALLLGSLYEAYGLYGEAETEFRRLADLNPSSALPGEMLASLSRLRQKSVSSP